METSKSAVLGQCLTRVRHRAHFSDARRYAVSELGSIRNRIVARWTLISGSNSIGPAPSNAAGSARSARTTCACSARTSTYVVRDDFELDVGVGAIVGGVAAQVPVRLRGERVCDRRPDRHRRVLREAVGKQPPR